MKGNFIFGGKSDECGPKNICQKMFDLGVNILSIEYFEWFVELSTSKRTVEVIIILLSLKMKIGR